MLRRSFITWAATAAGGPSQTAATAAGDRARGLRRQQQDTFMRFLHSNGAALDGVDVRPSAAHFRGIVAARTFRAGTTVVSVPLHALGVTSERLLRGERLRRLNPPSLEDVRRLLAARSVRDPVLGEQVHLALLLAGERLDPQSHFAPYLDALPCPAVDDAAVMRLHKDVLDPLQLVEWDDHQREWVTVFRTLARRWADNNNNRSGNSSESMSTPPAELCYWAWRTVLSRMHMLPNHGLAPAEMGSTLNYFALSTLERAERQTRVVKRIKGFIAAVFGNNDGAEDYRLVPTLVPLLDMTNHLSSGNVSVEVQPRPGVGSCAELQAVREIQAGEEIGLCFNRSHSPAFTLYRFGFLPV